MRNDRFWQRIQQTYEAQREKGIQTYGDVLENNKADILARLNYLSEELVDALMYIEWIKEQLSEDANER